ncbi:NADH:ubiquinone oxidoreductase [Tulasnella sp. 417]|nr:NADH:ubiquinone oxidoreductase [Tulasnella sp. 417]
MLKNTDTEDYSVETEALNVDPHNKQVTIADLSDIKGDVNNMTISYDIMVYSVTVGTESQPFGIAGVKDVTMLCSPLGRNFPTLRSFASAPCIESAAFPDQSEEEFDRLMHMIVVGGGPRGVEFFCELHDFISSKTTCAQDTRNSLTSSKTTLVEALPNVLPTFSRDLIQYTEIDVQGA